MTNESAHVECAKIIGERNREIERLQAENDGLKEALAKMVVTDHLRNRPAHEPGAEHDPASHALLPPDGPMPSGCAHRQWKYFETVETLKGGCGFERCENCGTERVAKSRRSVKSATESTHPCLYCKQEFPTRASRNAHEAKCSLDKITEKSGEQLVPAGHEQVATPEGDRGPSEYCGNWPCRLPRYHTGPCNSSPSQRTGDGL